MALNAKVWFHFSLCHSKIEYTPFIGAVLEGSGSGDNLPPEGLLPFFA